MFYEPRNGHGLRHDPFRSIVAPRPIGWISTLDAEGRVNLAPYSFFNAVSTKPPMLAFASDGVKDSVANARATGEFVFNLATRPLADAMNATSEVVPPEVDEFDVAGLERVPSTLVAPPRVKASPAALECKVTEILHLRDHTGKETERYLAIGEVVGVHIAEQYLTDGLFDIVAAQTIARLGYREYTQVDNVFELIRPGAGVSA